MLKTLIGLDLFTLYIPAKIIVVFFIYSHIGYILECIVLSAENKHLVVNRGFVRHLPFCIIYGFGALIGVPLLSLFENNLPVLFVVSAIGASTIELITARIQTKIFGDFWWDYTSKPFNYKGVLCLESTIGWGFAGIVIVKFLNKGVLYVTNILSPAVVVVIAIVLLGIYVADFTYSARISLKEKTVEEHEYHSEKSVF